MIVIKHIKRSFIILFMGTIANGQVGINTTAPNGLLDVNTTTQGIVYPNVSLTATNVQAPVINPQGGNLVAGTVVYNTNTTYTGNVTDVHPGIYVWNGTQWTIHFKKRQAQLYEQTSAVRTESNFAGNWQDIPGLGVSNAKTFVPKYSGVYKIIVKVNFGGGEMINNGNINVSAMEGNFRFTFDGTANTFKATSYSTYNVFVGSSGTHYANVWKESYTTIYLNLTASAVYSFYLEFDQLPVVGFVNSGNSGNGRGYIGQDIPCTIEFTYLDE